MNFGLNAEYIVLGSSFIILQKRFYTKGTIRAIRISRFIVIGWDPWSKKRVNYLSCIEGKGALKIFDLVTKYRAIFWSIIKYLLALHNILNNTKGIIQWFIVLNYGVKKTIIFLTWFISNIYVCFVRIFAVF